MNLILQFINIEKYEKDNSIYNFHLPATIHIE